MKILTYGNAHIADFPRDAFGNVTSAYAPLIHLATLEASVSGLETTLVSRVHNPPPSCWSQKSATQNTMVSLVGNGQHQVILLEDGLPVDVREIGSPTFL